jgi:outer membrane receptor protein involved in Fe transport
VALSHHSTSLLSRLLGRLGRASLLLIWVWLWTCAVCIGASRALADDVADEADMEFHIGAKRYEAGDYETALLHFLASNRLAANRNVVVNIALCYERLAQLPQAYSYYARSLEGETDEVVITRVRAALARMAPRVPLLRVVTEPAGARLYVDRRDLGERGSTPQTLALAAGRYRVFAELDGYRPAQSDPVELVVGKEHVLNLQLQRIVGIVGISGTDGASVFLDSDVTPLCELPCAAPVPPGQHTLLVSKPGYRLARVPIWVVADEEIPLVTNLAVESGSLIVNADERGATLEVDGVVRGLIPMSLDLPVGSHRVRASLHGFQPLEQEVLIRADQHSALDLKLAADEVVEAASRLSEPAEEAPASISLISNQELRSMRYPTLAEALRGTRGLYLTDDGGYTKSGFRGLSLPGSYGKRMLVTVDGMPANDSWSWASTVGYGLRTDLEDIDRIEVVRGPGSVVYGTSAFTGVVNLVSRGREVPSGAEAGVSAVGDGVFRARARLTHHLDERSGFWLSLGAGAGEGRDFFFPEYVSRGPAEVAGHARGLDATRFGTLLGQAWWGDFTLAWSLNQHLKYIPTGQYEALFGDGRAQQKETRGILEARFERPLGTITTSVTRVHANLYRYRSYIPFAPDEGGLDTTHFNGAWLGAEQRFLFAPSASFDASVGTEAQAFPLAHVRESSELGGEYLDDRRQLLVAAVYTNVDVRPVRQVKLSAGARLDYYSSAGASLNPRLALVAQPYEAGNLKVLFGKAFIAPSISEAWYAYYDLLSNPDLRPENLYSAEVELSHRLSPLVVATASTYANYVTDLILLEDLPPEADGNALQQYRNARTAVGTLGMEAELRRDWKSGYMLEASYSFQSSTYLRSRSLGDLLTLERSDQFRELPNSPRHLASVHAAAPLVSRALRVMSRLSYEAGRYDRYSDVGDPPQTQTRGALIWDFVFNGADERIGLEYSLGIYNALDAKAAHPVSSEFLQRAVPSPGRSLLAAVNVRF